MAISSCRSSTRPSDVVRDAYISGIGQSDVGVGLVRHPLLMTVDAIREALDEAGLTIADIDGVCSWPGRLSGSGTSPVGTEDVIDALGIRATYYSGGIESPSQLGAVMDAVGAVQAGHARHVICFRTVYEAAARARPHEFAAAPSAGVDGWLQWLLPFNAMSAANWTAQYAMRHMTLYGLTREQLAQIALTDRANGLLNPRALIREPLTMDQYMTARMISTPLCLYDCDRFTDASVVLIVSAGETIGDLRCTPVRIAAIAYAVDRHSWDQPELLACYQTGPRLWQKTDYRPKDVDTAQLYDGFSFQTVAWLESLGFCGIGEGGQFIEGGQRIALDGELPLNTSGGQIASGRLHGFGFAHEAVLQLRGLGGARQVKGDPKVAVAASGFGSLATAILFARD